MLDSVAFKPFSLYRRDQVLFVLEHYYPLETVGASIPKGKAIGFTSVRSV